ncbi:hypothetical protein AYK26_03855 [Euryarchaeota archaeon SM23-78]|nr:MAG: hypothetical protein AYK26_03855 [Euryarchaeota archaeon SM23-78]MBW3001102.1 hypothetical protein [Candidatus Woesearchaeota archaeon]
MKRIDWVLILLILGFVAIVLMYIFEPGAETVFDMFTYIVTIGLPLITVALGVYLAKVFGTRSLQGKAILFLTIGFFCWTVGEILWIIYEEAVVSFADVAYLLTYPFLMIGIFYGIKMSTPDIFKNKKRIIFLVLITIAAVGVYLYFFPFAWDLEVSFIENLVTSGYVIADLLLIIPLIFLSYSLISGKLSLGWILIGLGIISTLIADLWYVQNYEIYALGKQYIDLLWYLMFFLVIYALVYFKRVQRQIKEKVMEVKEKEI